VTDFRRRTLALLGATSLGAIEVHDQIKFGSGGGQPVGDELVGGLDYAVPTK
jgi:hypothetical protein